MRIRPVSMWGRIPVAAAGAIAALLAAGCGLRVSSPDLFQLTRSGPGGPLTLIVGDAGTVRCNLGAAKPLSDPLLLQARGLVTALATDAKAKLRSPASPGSVFRYAITMQDGTISFADTSAFGHPELARAEQFAVQVAREVCGLAG
jgi:hypothetical protein